ncbi:MAG TPA: NAD(P)H-binding protein [Trebonia sp.]
MIVVTGATGNVGRPLTAALASAGHAVTAVARGISAELPGGQGIVPVSADLTSPAAADSLAASMAGADAFFLLVPGAGAGVDAAGLLETARTAGIGRVVLLSSQAVGTRPGSAAYAPMAAIEAAVTGSGLGGRRRYAAGRPCSHRTVTSPCQPSTRSTSRRPPRPP